MKNVRKLLLAAAMGISLIGVSMGAQAHRAWMVPSGTVMSGSDAWVTVDVAVANGLFVFDHVPLRLDRLTVTMPGGKTLAPENVHTGKLRSVFDLHLTALGTYRLQVLNSGLFAQYQENGKPKRWRGSEEALAKEVPANAEGLKVTETMGRVETFVTLGAPDKKVLTSMGKGLELEALTHPNDLVAKEAARFRFLIDGKPAADLDVSVIPGGTRYRDDSGEMRLKTDKEGKVTVAWPQAGWYYLAVSSQDDKTTSKKAKERRLSYAATFEVLP